MMHVVLVYTGATSVNRIRAMRNRWLGIGVGGYAVILAAFWIGVRYSATSATLGVGFPRTFASFALLLAPLWFFAFCDAEPLQEYGSGLQIGLAALLAVPYLVFAAGTSVFQTRMALAMLVFPVLLAGFLALPQLSAKMTWRDVSVLVLIAAAYFLRWFQPAWPGATSSMFAKLFLADLALYCFLVARRLNGTGYSLVPTCAAAWIGLREWLFYLPFALVIGELTGFIQFHSGIPHAASTIETVVITFLLIALPEELFFRGVLQNLLETRLGRLAGLILASALFGLSHLNHGSAFNWRYVLLATIAGIFYGRAWRAQRQILASVVTHTFVDVVWSLWFR